MTKAKKILIAVIAIIMIPAVFLAGYFTGTHGLTFSVGSTSANEPVRDEADSSEEEIVDSVSEYLKPDASYSGSYREMLSDSVVPIYDTLKKHLLDEKRYDNIEFYSHQQTAVKVSYFALLQDHPEIFWVEGSISSVSIYTDDDGKRKVTMQFRELYPGSLNDIDKGFSELASAVNEIKILRNSDSRYDTLKAIQDYICYKVSYDEKMDSGISSFLDSFIAPLLGCGTNSNTLICGGYAKSFKALCNQFDIPCVILYGESMGWPHCWNLVQMEDGKWYGIDVTNDDAKNPNNYQYHNFLKGSNSRILGENQFFWGYEDITKFGEANIPYDSNDYYSIKFPYPTISDEAYQPSN